MIHVDVQAKKIVSQSPIPKKREMLMKWRFLVIPVPVIKWTVILKLHWMLIIKMDMQGD